jgi:hypothetical protein
VQKVMANAHLYATRLGLKAIPLKKRLGTIPSSSGLVTGGEDNTEPEIVEQKLIEPKAIELAPIEETK